MAPIESSSPESFHEKPHDSTPDTTKDLPPIDTIRVFFCGLISLTFSLVVLLSVAPVRGEDRRTGPWVRGQVVDTEGLPLTRARITLEAIERPYEDALRRLHRLDPEIVTETRSRADGYFQLRTPTPGLWRVRVSHDGHGGRFFDLRALVTDRVLQPVNLPRAVSTEVSFAASLAGEVFETPSGIPAPHAAVALPASSWFPVSPRTEAPETWQTDWPWSRLSDTGKARLTLESGISEWSFLLHLAGRPARRTGTAPAPRTPALPIRTVDPRGEPVAGVVVGLRGAAFPQLVTDADGRGTLHFPSLDPWWVELNGPGGEVGWVQPELPAEGSDPESIDLVVGPPNGLEGRVVDRDLGLPVAGAWVFSRLERSGLVVRSDAEGRFRLPVREVRGELGAAAPGFLPFSRRFSTRSKLEDHGVANPIPDIPLRAAALTYGRVTDLEDVPIAGVEIRISLGSLDPRSAKNKVLATATTDDDGRFAPGPLPVGFYDLQARAEGRAPLTVRGVEVPRQDPVRGPVDLGTLVLASGLVLDGRVVDTEGRPVAGAEAHYGASPRLFASRVKGAGKVSISSADGRFILRDLSPGEQLTLVVAKEGYLDQVLARVEVTDRQPLEVVLERATTVRGRVLDSAGSPVAGAEIRLAPEGGGGIRMEGLSSEASSDAEGRFVLRGVPPGRVGLEAWAEGFQRWWRNGVEVPDEEGLEDFEIVLEEGFEVYGTVFDAEGQPSPRTPVIAHRPSSPRPMASTSTDGEGSYRLRGLGPGPYQVMASREYQVVRQSLEIDGGGGGALRAGEYRLDLRFAPTLSVSGRVISNTGRPVAGATVEVSPLGGSEMLDSARATSQEDGRFRLRGLRSAVYSIEASHRDFAPLRFDGGLEVGETDIEGLELVLRPGATLRGRVSGLEHEELAKVEVSTDIHWAKPDFEGHFVFENLVVGSSLVTAEVVGTGRITQELVVIEEGAGDAEVELSFGDGLRLTAQLTHLGLPLAGAAVAAQGLDVPGESFTRTDPDGAFVFEGLAAGLYRLVIKDLASGLEHRQEIRLDHDEHLEIDLVTTRVAGRVVSPDGQGVAEVPVRLRRSDDPAIELRTGSDSQGVFAFGMVRPGRWKILALRPGAPVEREIDVFDGGIENLELIVGPSPP